MAFAFGAARCAARSVISLAAAIRCLAQFSEAQRCCMPSFAQRIERDRYAVRSNGRPFGNQRLKHPCVLLAGDTPALLLPEGSLKRF
jgi:hypothetical protein